MRLEGRRVIVTGGAGFIGSHVVDLLVADRNQVIVLDDLSSGSLGNLSQHLDRDPSSGPTSQGTVEVIETDVRDADAMDEMVADADVVIHMAEACVRTSLGRPALVQEVNATGSLNVALAAHRNNVGRLVHVSSAAVYGSARRVPMDENSPPVPTTVYGAAKRAGEAYCQVVGRLYGIDVTIVRPFNAYGPREPHRGQQAEVIPKFVLRVMAGARPIVFGSGLQTRDFTWVDDTARGILAVAAEDAVVGGIVNVGRGQEISIRQLAEKVLAIFGRSGELPVFDAARPGEINRHVADTRKIVGHVGWVSTVSIDEGLRRYVDWLAGQEVDLDRWLTEDQPRNW